MADKVLPKAMEDVSWAKPPIQHSSPQPPRHLSTPLGLGFPFPEPIFIPRTLPQRIFIPRSVGATLRMSNENRTEKRRATLI